MLAKSILYLIRLLGFTVFVVATEGKKCPSVCTADVSGCKLSGGKIVGYCVNGLACCDLTVKTTGNCGDVKKGDQINFISPSYPNFHKNDLLCTFSMTMWEETIGVKLEFVDVVMDGLGYAGNGAGCDSDMFYIRGFKTWTPPPMCGNLTGYSTVIERTIGSTRMDKLTLVGLMSSDKYRWKIKLTQIKPSSSKRKESGKDTLDKSKDKDGTQSLYNDVLKPWTTDSLTVTNKGHLVSKMWGENNYDSVEILNTTTLKPTRRKRKAIKSDIDNGLQLERPLYDQQLQPPSLEIQTVSHIYPDPDSENIFSEGQGQGQDQGRGFISDSVGFVGSESDEDDILSIEMPMIVNGRDTEIKEVPWQVSIRLKHARVHKSSKNRTALGFDNDDDDDGGDGEEDGNGNIGSIENDSMSSTTTILPGSSEEDNKIFNGNGTSGPGPDIIMLNDTETSGNNANATTSTEVPILDLKSTTEPEPEIPARNCSDDEGSHFCGGSIISDRHILTAAHCFFGSTKLRGMEQLDTIKIVLGDTDACTRDFPEPGSGSGMEPTPTPSGNMTEQEHEIETVFIHYAYDNIALINDVAVIKLKRRIDFNGNVKPVKMASVGESFDGKEAIASGWGMKNLTDKSAELPYILQSSRRFQVRNSSECNSETERLFGAPLANVTKHPKYSHAFKSILCTETKFYNASTPGGELVKREQRGEVLVGPGDSGGPLVSESNNGEMVLIGVVSYGIPPEGAKNAGEYIDFFQSVAYYKNWIELTMTD